ncbi:MAG TPA: hypothetical protein VMU51_10580 [Mycobacteriales bacterium]|nr:hypothetical protein [Mycobacteriales bacterium]
MIDAMTNKIMEPAAISLACSRHMANEEIARTAVYRPLAPVGGWMHGSTLPVAGFPRLDQVQGQAAPLTVIDRKPATVRGPAPRGRPV